jgi:hypothetical protein
LEEDLVNEFGSDWSRQKLLCYDVRAAVITTLGYLELIEEEKANESAVKKALKGALKNTRAAAQKVEELFQEICKAETPR